MYSCQVDSEKTKGYSLEDGLCNSRGYLFMWKHGTLWESCNEAVSSIVWYCRNGYILNSRDKLLFIGKFSKVVHLGF